MTNWLTYRIKVGDNVLVLADEEARELIKNETERSKKADEQTASFLESTTTNGIIRNSKSDPFGQTAIGEMKVVIDEGDLIINGNIKNHTRLTRTYNVTQENRTEVFLYRFDSVTNEIAGLWRDCIIQGDIIMSREDKTELPLRSSGYYDILICKITIPAGATEITQDMIGDFRQNEYYCGYAKNLLVDIDETLTKSDAAADAAAVGTVIGDLRNETRTRDIITEKRITNLEAGLPAERWSVDDSVAYIKDVPENALPFASVDMIGGMTYKDGDVLRSAKVKSVESVGTNVLDDASITLGPRWDVNDDGYIVPTSNGMFRALMPMKLKPNTTYFVGSANSTLGKWAIWFTDGNYKVLGRTVDWTQPNATFTTPSFYCYAYLTGWYNATEYQNDIMIHEGTTALPYTPYRRETLTIPEAVRPRHGINADVYDSITWDEDGKQRKRVKCGEVDMGALNWGELNHERGRTFMAHIPEMKPSTTAEDRRLGFVCIPYDPSSNIDVTSLDNKSAVRRENSYFYIRDDDYTNAAAFKAAMSGVRLVYELAEPVITDISDLLPDDNLIGVEGRCTVTTVNDYWYRVPSKITYQLKGAET